MTGSFEDYPFGEVKSSTGCPASNQRFTGKFFDNESGLQYFGARYLSNDLTRFTSVDPAPNSTSIYPQSWNKYAYSFDDPINLFDPDGGEVKVAPMLNVIVTQMRGRSNSFNATLKLYEGTGSIDLVIKEQSIPSDPVDGKLSGNFTPDLDQKSLNYDTSKVTGTTTNEQLIDLITGVRYTGAQITIQPGMKDKDKKETLAHEVGHADQAPRDPVAYEKARQKDPILKAKGVSHDKRPAEQYADKYKDKVLREIQP